jgi:hypothetical protein
MEAFYEVLRNAEIRETDGVSSDLLISQDGIHHRGEGKKTTLHIAESQSGLKIYLPRNKDDQEYMFTQLLSQKLFEWMTTHPVTQICEDVKGDGAKVLRDILLAPRSRTSMALEDNGILTVSVSNVDEDVDPVSPSMPGDEVSGVLATRDQADSDLESFDTNPPSVFSPPLYQHGIATPSGGSPFTLSSSRQSSSSPFGSPALATPGQTASSDLRYAALLDKVVTSARRRGFPPVGAISSMLAIDRGTDLGINPSGMDRDLKIGAAGELYVSLRPFDPALYRGTDLVA